VRVAQEVLIVSKRQKTFQLRTTDFYDGAAQRYAEFADQLDMSTILGKFFSTVARGHTVLDIGCGSGRDLATLRDIAAVAFGVDLSIGLLAKARCTSEAPVLRADASSLPVADGRIDRVLAVASLHHLPRKAQIEALHEIRRVLHPDGGKAIITLKVGRRARRDRDTQTRRARVFYLTSSKTFVRRARQSGLCITAAERSTSFRHGRKQAWLAVQVVVATRTSGEPPNRRPRAAWRRRSWVQGPSNFRRGRAAT